MASASFRSIATANVTTASAVVTFPSGTAVGDLVVFSITNSGGTAGITTPAGWTRIGALQVSPTHADRGAGFFWRVIDGTEGGSVTVAMAGNSFGTYYAVAVKTSGGALTLTAGSVGTTTLSGGSTASAISSSYANAYVATFFIPSSITVGGSWTGPPAGETARNASPPISDQIQVAAGTTGTKAVTYSGTVETAWMICAIEHVPVVNTITANTGVVSVTGNAAPMPLSRNVSAATGTVALAASATGLPVTRRVTALPGAVALVGQPASLPVGRRSVSASGACAVAGIATPLPITRRAIALTGALDVGGGAAVLSIVRRIVAGSGSLSVSSSGAAMSVRRVAIASTGAAAADVRDAVLRVIRSTRADAGPIGVAGTAAPMPVARRLAAAPGAVITIVRDAELTILLGLDAATMRAFTAHAIASPRSIAAATLAHARSAGRVIGGPRFVGTILSATVEVP